jgi:hypothetical protein
MLMGRSGPWWVALLLASCVLASCDGGGEPTPLEKFRVGGTLSGLSGRITLQLNQGEALAHEADGPFSFETPLEEGADYTVSVALAPPEQDCAVEGGTGKVARADVSTVQVRCASRTYPLGGTVEGLEAPLSLSLGGETLTLQENGRFTFATRLLRGGTYTVGVTSSSATQRCEVSNASGTVTGAVEDLSVRCFHSYTFDPFPQASVVLGQGSFTSKTADRGGRTSAGTLNGPVGNPVFLGGRLYVSDRNSHRVLGFNGMPSTPGASADFVLGQATLTDSGLGDEPTNLTLPSGLSGDGTSLVVADTGNSRLLLYAPPPASTGTAPTRVLGQPDLQSRESRCDQASFSFPKDVFLGRGKLLVADGEFNRVLVWNTPPTTEGQLPDLVLGQRDFTHCAVNDADGDGTKDSTPGPTTLWNPTGVWTDGTRLVVADSYNHRVLIWNTFPTRSGQPANAVLGQKDFTSNAPALSDTGMDTPLTVAATGAQLFVADSENHRVLIWNELPSTSGRPANAVLGQSDFSHKDRNDPPLGNTPSARSLSRPSGLLLSGPHVVVTDTGNNRLLLFRSP